MSQSVSDTTLSPTPFSPFSSYSVASGATSDDAPDLGAFTTVFRELTILQPHAIPIPQNDAWNAPTASSSALSPSEYDSEVTGDSTVWSQRRIRSYLAYSSPESPRRGRSPSPSGTESTASTEGEELPEEGTGNGSDAGEAPAEQPSLGYLDEALEFLAAERARIAAQRDVGVRETSSTTSDSLLRRTLQPRRKRRSRRKQSVHEVSILRRPEQGEDEPTDTANGTDRPGDDTETSSSSVDPSSSSNVKSASDNVQPFKTERVRQRSTTAKPQLHLHHSKSTPSFRLPVTAPFDAHVLQLRNLATKLRLFFPADTASLTAIYDTSHPQATELADPRGPVPRSEDTLIHVFIDHSNILIGFLSYLRKHPHPSHHHHKPKHLSHAALALVLERGRPITRRVLVASSPLYQPLEAAEQLGYEVRVYVRVPDTGDMSNRRHSYTNGNTSSSSNRERMHAPSKLRDRERQHTASSPKSAFTRGHTQRASYGGGTSTESEMSGDGAGAGIRMRYREQGVDELLQLKLHQAIAHADVVPPGATIVLATGDGNEGQFNEEGFLGVVRTALKKGWRVELYAWEGGLSRAWMREFGEGPYRSKFEIYMLDQFAVDMLDMGEVS